jgi:hypothetical protein
MKAPLALLLTLLLPPLTAGCQPDTSHRGGDSYITWEKTNGSFALYESGAHPVLLVSAMEDPGVIRAASDLASDLERVTGTRPELILNGDNWDSLTGLDGPLILLGTAGLSPLIDRLAGEGTIDPGRITGHWEASLTAVVEEPLPGVQSALVIAGSDRRGTIFGIYELSRQIGVSPWHYWADVIPETRECIYVVPGTFLIDEPAVKYRGIFINDEAPALAGWAEERFGGFNHEFYGHVFELILRMKGNYLWPAMWGRAFYDDDSLNAPLAHQYGVVIGTTHHEPLMRAHVEWARYGSGPWDYTRNQELLQAFWREGIRRMGEHESIVSLGMRGDGDEPMTEGTAISLLEGIVADQRNIIGEVTGKDPSETPQLWALYKEVQDYYDKGMRVPDDVTLLLCDDNWGNLRKLPDPAAPPRSGGYGIYYHFDYVGGPRNYKWLNTNQIERVWEQMQLAFHYGAHQIWIVNVGDIQPMELPTQFFLDHAWDPHRWKSEDVAAYYRKWAAEQFGEVHAAEIAGILAGYTRFNARRKPELLSPQTYSLTHHREAEQVVEEYNELDDRADSLYKLIPDRLRDAYYQLVLFPVKACANLNELYAAAGRNRLYAEQGRASTNAMAERVRELFEQDIRLTEAYHRMAGGKWNHMMSQTHIGYTYWQQPEENAMPELAGITLSEGARMGVALEGSIQAWPGSFAEPVLPVFDPLSHLDQFIEVFNRGSEPFECTIVPGEPWILPGRSRFMVGLEERIAVQIDWAQVPKGIQRVPVEISGAGDTVTVYMVADNRAVDRANLPVGTFLESSGAVTMEAEHFHLASGSGQVEWVVVPNLGRTLSSVITLPVDAGPTLPGGDAPRLEYRFFARDTGEVTIHLYLSPTLDFFNSGGLRYALSVDYGRVQTVNMHDPGHPGLWNQWVADNIIVKSSTFRLGKPGLHSLEFWRIDPGVVLQKIVVQTAGDWVPGYLGPPESPRVTPSPPPPG